MPATPDRTASPLPLSLDTSVEQLQPRGKVPKEKRPRLPPVSPSTSKIREPHPAWRVVGGGVSLASMKSSSSEDMQDEDDVERQTQVVADESAALQQQQQLQPMPMQLPAPVSVAVPVPQPPVQTFNGYPASAVPQHHVYNAYARPSPVAYELPTGYFAPPAVAAPWQPQQVQVQVPSSPMWPQTPPQQQQPAGQWFFVPAAPQPQPQPQQYVAPAPQMMQPVPAFATPSAYGYSVPDSQRSLDHLASYGVDVSAVDAREPPFLSVENPEYDNDGYGVQDELPQDGAEIEMGFGTLHTAPTSSGQHAFSWADEMEDCDPQYGSPTAPMDVDVDVVGSGLSSSWPQARRTAPNSPRVPVLGGLYNESP